MQKSNNNNKKIFEILNSKTKIYLIVIAILLIIICVQNTGAIIPSIIGYICIFGYAYWTNSIRETEISKHIQEITVNLDTMAKKALINAPIPLAIVETDGTIRWKSAKFMTTFRSKDLKKEITEITKAIKLEIESKKDKKDNIILEKVEINGAIYNVVCEYIKENKRKNQEHTVVLYFMDITELEEEKQLSTDRKTCVSLVSVDNYDELIQRMSNEERPQVIASIEKAIYDWAGISHGVMIKNERDKFVYVFDNQYLNDIKENKFEILDTVKEIEFEGIQQITLSIAISVDGESVYEKYKMAQTAMEIAEGRGGDQAVIIEEGKYSFFGGRAQEMEKRTRVKVRNVAHAISGLLSEASNVIIMGHTNPDIDAIGSALGMYRIATTLGKEAYIVTDSKGLTLDAFLTEVKKEPAYDNVFISSDEAKSKVTQDTLLIIVDTHKANYVEVPELLNKTDKIVLIDHHRRSADFIEKAILTFHEVYASSAAELVTELVQYVEGEPELSTIETEGLYAGIMMDTKNFTFKTGVRTFEAAAYLRKCGVDIIRVKKWFQSNFENYAVIADIVKSAEIVRDNIAIAIYDAGDKEAGLICAKAADELLTISDITASFVIGNLGKNGVCISGRSIGDINVQVILEKLGGGGHITVAGAQAKDKTCEEEKEVLLEKIDEYFAELGN